MLFVFNYSNLISPPRYQYIVFNLQGFPFWTFWKITNPQKKFPLFFLVATKFDIRVDVLVGIVFSICSRHSLQQPNPELPDDVQH